MKFPLALSVSLVMFSSSLSAQDAVEVSPDKYEVVFENDRVRVLEVRYQPGDSSGLHYHPDNIVITLSDGVARHTDVDGNESDSVFRFGQVVWREAETHGAANPGDAEFHLIFVELKDSE